MKLMKLKIFLGVVVVSAIAFAADDFAIGPVLVKGKGVEIRRSQLDDAFVAFPRISRPVGKMCQRRAEKPQRRSCWTA